MADPQVIDSTTFRRTYARLTEPVVVTVLGRPIGRWTPMPAVAARADASAAIPTPAPDANSGDGSAPRVAVPAAARKGRRRPISIDLTKRA